MPRSFFPQHAALRLTALVTLLTLSPSRLHAQSPRVDATPALLPRCTYETCAIRLDRSFFRGQRVNVGLDAVSSSMGWDGGGLVRAVDAVPLAGTEATMGRRNRIRATVAGVIGGLLVTYALQGARGDPLEWNDGQVFGGLIVGTGATLVAAQQAIYAERHFSRAIWLYNREIPR